MTVPVWAYGVAFGGAFLAARALNRGGGAGPAADVAGGAPTAQPTVGADASAGGGYGDYGGGGSGYGLGDGGGLGSIPYPVGDDGYVDTPPPPVVVVPPTPAPAQPPPTPAPAPAPTGTVIAKPRTAPPSGAIGWTIVMVGQPYYNPVAGWNGSYPVRVTGATAYNTRTARWISGTKTAIHPSGSKFSVRRVSHKDTVDGQWANDFVNASSRVYPTSTPSVRL